MKPQAISTTGFLVPLAATHFNDPKVSLEVSEDLTGAMKGLAVAGMDEAQMLQTKSKLGALSQAVFVSLISMRKAGSTRSTSFLSKRILE
jgi:hypothetical protein